MSLPGSGQPATTNVTREHLTPKSQGGKQGGANLVAACSRCNNARGTQPWWEFLQMMRSHHDVFEQTVCTQVALFWPPIESVVTKESDLDLPLVALVARWARPRGTSGARRLSPPPNQ
ncbi:HNH endonuclease [Hyphomicrobium sp. LHD-15]|uniref:HNH endonuclease n=1 Tax=Hyphomicrobium sp. LHD-15 TaxID=3072142 RepID=UPI0035BE87F8